MKHSKERQLSQAQNPDGLAEYMLSDPEFTAYISDPNHEERAESDQIRNRGGKPTQKTNQIGRSKPAWLCEIPSRVQPSDSSRRKLEELRQHARIPHREFARMVLQSPGITKMLVERQFEEFRSKRPHATDRELFNFVLQFRYFTTDIADGMTPEDAQELLRQTWRQSIIMSVVEEIKTIDDLVHYITDEYEEFWKHTPDPQGINSQIAEILGYHRQDRLEEDEIHRPALQQGEST